MLTPTTSWMTSTADTSSTMRTRILPPLLSILKEAVNPMEQKNIIMKKFFSVSSKWNSATSA